MPDILSRETLTVLLKNSQKFWVAVVGLVVTTVITQTGLPFDEWIGGPVGIQALGSAITAGLVWLVENQK